VAKLSFSEVKEAFPAPTFRRYQLEVLKRITELFNSDYRVVILSAPTGSGKSYINAAFCKLMKSFYATPQLNLIDQIMRDKYLGEKYFVEIKGRQNYRCHYDEEATVDVGVCVRTKFVCLKTEVCPYWIQKMRAIRSQSVIFSLAYLILEGSGGDQVPPFLGKRELCVLDESHNLDRHIINQVSLEVSPFTIPERVYEKIKEQIPKIRDIVDARALINLVSKMLDYELAQIQITLEGEEISIHDAQMKNKMEEFKKLAEIFLESESPSNEWVYDVKWITYKGKAEKKLILQPLYAKHFAPDLVWDKAEYFIVSSATILNTNIYSRGNFISETGMDLVFRGDQIKVLEVPSTFPKENRPIVPMWEKTGKMTKEKVEENLPKTIEVVKEIMKIEGLEKKCCVHCHSYEIAEKFAELCRRDPLLKDRIISHNSLDRKEKYEEWLQSRGKIFISVAFEEGYDWVGELCDYQILLKVPFLDIEDKRVARRLELKHWNWYYLEALKETIQAYGRAIRSAEDRKRFYVLDESFKNLVRRTRKYMPKWFQEVIPEEVLE
jgi:Rad3-related DNA helicase